MYKRQVHEVLIVPDNGEMEPKMLGEMVREVNKNEAVSYTHRDVYKRQY